MRTVFLPIQSVRNIFWFLVFCFVILVLQDVWYCILISRVLYNFLFAMCFVIMYHTRMYIFIFRLKSLVSERCGSKSKTMNIKLLRQNRSLGYCCEFALIWTRMSQKRTYAKSTFVQVMICCLMAPNHYLGQCWPRSMSLYDVTRPTVTGLQWCGTCYPLQWGERCDA